MTDNIDYLGDGLYASWDGEQLELYTSNGIEVTNRVYLNQDNFPQFVEYLVRVVGWVPPGVRK